MTEKPKSRQEAYRERQAAELRELRRLQGLVAGHTREPEPNDRQWFAVQLSVNRENKQSTIKYMMDGRNTGRLLSDLETSDPENPKVGHYAFVYHEDAAMPGMTTLVLTGISVASLEKIDGYRPPYGYSVSDGAVSLLIKGVS